MAVRFITKDGRKIPIKIVSGEIRSSPRMIKKEKRQEHDRTVRLKEFKKQELFHEIEKENVHESVAHIMRVFPEALVNIKRVGSEMGSSRSDPTYDIEVRGGMLVGDFENLNRHGINVSSFHATKEGNIKFNVDIPKHLRQSSPKKINKVEFGMKNIGLPHIKKGIMEISSGNINETEQEKLRMLFDAGLPKGKSLTKKQRDRIAEIDRMADPHEIGLASSPFGSRI